MGACCVWCHCTVKPGIETLACTTMQLFELWAYTQEHTFPVNSFTVQASETWHRLQAGCRHSKLIERHLLCRTFGRVLGSARCSCSDVS